MFIMNTSIKERRQTLIFRIAFIGVILAFLVVFALVGAEAYVRWTLNKDFSFLGGSELEVLTASLFVLILGMVHAYSPKGV